jgi:hypothetical protein
VPFYFAYGSNMSAAVFRERAAGESAGPAVLRGRRLAFTLPSRRWGDRAADLAAAEGAAVWGRLWRVDEAQFRSLDRYEAAYRRQEVTVERGAAAGPDIVPAITYVVRAHRRAPDEAAPAPAYLARMLEGAAECGLPGYYLARLRAAGPASGECGDPPFRGV